MTGCRQKKERNYPVLRQGPYAPAGIEVAAAVKAEHEAEAEAEAKAGEVGGGGGGAKAKADGAVLVSAGEDQ